MTLGQRHLFASLVIAMLIPAEGKACSVLTPAAEAQRERHERNFLLREADKSIVGTWHLERADDDHKFGYVEVIRRKQVIRYRLYISRIINCGFPNFNVEHGDSGRFYLTRSDVPESDDLEDGFIDNFDFVHFRPKEALR